MKFILILRFINIFLAAVCPAPLVHYECYKRSCEPTCTSMGENEQCPQAPGVCFSGCFCPEGLIRKGDECINATDCRDCEFYFRFSVFF